MVTAAATPHIIDDGAAAGWRAVERLATVPAMSAAPAEHPICPTCGQPADEGLADGGAVWECRNEACPEFGQVVARGDAPPPGDD
jgi:hypothetical protein